MAQQVLEPSVLVTLRIRKWTGTAKMDKAEAKVVDQTAGIRNQADGIRASTIFKGGNIDIFNPEDLKVFRNIQTEVTNRINAVGLKIDRSVWLVSEANMPELEQALAETYSLWERTLSDFEASYPMRAAEWAATADGGKWGQAILQRQPAPEEIRSKFVFKRTTFKYQPDCTGQPGNETAELVAELPNQALQSLIDSLKELYDESFNKPDNPSGKAYNALAKIARRAAALGFANPEAARFALVLQDLVTQKNHTLSRLVLSRMAVPQDVADILAINDGQGIDSLLVTPSKPDLSVTTDSLLEQAKQMLNPPMTAVNDSGDIIRTDTNEVVMSAKEIAQIAPAPAQSAPAKPLNSMDVLDSLGLF